ncbi:MAG: hypothetical protein M1541_03160 [Acidobacteria bacterium]|nr:hypothetical protein [Acidobacteriota bacterium]
MPATRYVPSRHYLVAGVAACGLTVFSAWWALRWSPALLAAFLFAATAAFVFSLALRPPIEVCEKYLKIGRRKVVWEDIRRLDRAGWVSPLVVHITLYDDSRILLVYPGDLDSGNSLLRHMRRQAREALIDGVPHREFWGEILPSTEPPEPPPETSGRFLRPEDEAEVERLFQRLKSVGYLDQRNSSDEN